MKKLLIIIPVFLSILFLAWCNNITYNNLECEWITYQWFCRNNVFELCDSIVDYSRRDWWRNENQQNMFNECITENKYLFDK